MEKLKLKADYGGTQIINILFAEGKSVEINVSDDVDLTELIKEFTLLIRDDLELELQKFESEDQKLILIQNTIEKIIESFNQSIEVIEETDDEGDVPF